MNSIQLQQDVSLAVDSILERGEAFTVREVADKALSLIHKDHWSLQDRREADFAFVVREIKTMIKGPSGKQARAFMEGNVPTRYKDLPVLPRALCRLNAGANSKWIPMASATAEDFEGLIGHLDRLSRSVELKSDDAAAWRNVLRESGCQTIGEMFAKELAPA